MGHGRIHGEQGHIDDEKSTFWTSNDNEYSCILDHLRAVSRRGEKEKKKKKKKGRGEKEKKEKNKGEKEKG